MEGLLAAVAGEYVRPIASRCAGWNDCTPSDTSATPMSREPGDVGGVDVGRVGFDRDVAGQPESAAERDR